MRTLHLTLKKKWFDMIASGEKKEEYRDIKQYWLDRLCFNNPVRIHELVDFNTDYRTVHFRNGYSKNAPTITIECLGITVGKPKSEWSDNWQGEVFIIKLGEIIK